MNIKQLLLATLNDSGPASVRTLRDTMFVAGGGLPMCCNTSIALHCLIRDGLVKVECGVYSAA